VSNTRSKEIKTVGEARAAKRSNPLVAAILDAEDIPYRDEVVPEWGDIKLRIRGLDGKARDRYEAELFMMRTSGDEMTLDMASNRNARLLARCLFDPETDERLPLTEDDLGAKSGTVVRRLADIAIELSGLGRKAAEAAGKDSETDPSESSTTG
jgi:hypothetical protein